MAGLAANADAFVQRTDAIAEFADRLVTFVGPVIFEDPHRLNREIDRLRSVTAADVRAFAGTYFGADNRAVVRYEPRGNA